MTLTVPAPTISQAGATPPVLSVAKAIELECGPVTTADGTVVEPPHATLAGFRVYRVGSAGDVEVWDAGASAWVAGDATPAPEPLAHRDGSWRGLLVAIGKKDAAGIPAYATEPAGGQPRYFFRCIFRARVGGGPEDFGEGPRSPEVQLLPAGSDHRGGLLIDPEDPTAAREVRMFVRDAGLAERGRVLVRSEAGGWAVELQAAGARVRIEPDGEISLAPAPGGRVHVAGPLVVDGSLTASGTVIAP